MEPHIQPMADSDTPTGVSIHNGFPNPAAEQFVERSTFAFDLNQLLVKHPSSTYLFRVAGEQWSMYGIYDGDIAIIDRALLPKPHSLVLIWQHNTFELTRFNQREHDRCVWGVATNIIHTLQRNKHA